MISKGMYTDPTREGVARARSVRGLTPLFLNSLGDDDRAWALEVAGAVVEGLRADAVLHGDEMSLDIAASWVLVAYQAGRIDGERKGVDDGA